MILCNGYTLNIVKLKDCWAVEAKVGEETRYRKFHYKKDAERDLNDWKDYRNAGDFMRDFHHNFYL